MTIVVEIVAMDVPCSLFCWQEFNSIAASERHAIRLMRRTPLHFSFNSCGSALFLWCWLAVENFLVLTSVHGAIPSFSPYQTSCVPCLPSIDLAQSLKSHELYFMLFDSRLSGCQHSCPLLAPRSMGHSPPAMASGLATCIWRALGCFPDWGGCVSR